ncbi:LOW QUALITY PROTEIN: hypothetical protein BU14_0412s0004 [Porphyra umbilicalis]|uniref:Uncharacterized protein n=1 Tax=Porphyra umbilicalis TaxID=2786 RepID=A0A1X6NW11_PORUM|nr:LOW QUALITY PROTEIN: hypothetical protein BU14_0412s0004 [Porphyra umbilicalis]|eukprot:OSX72710.1 LOW QUALITY PROTEIN: hypothetical protein BU14_0412s0004 [Porphyra umbilicalis]
MTSLSPPPPTHTRRERAAAPRPRPDVGSARHLRCQQHALAFGVVQGGVSAVVETAANRAVARPLPRAHLASLPTVSTHDVPPRPRAPRPGPPPVPPHPFPPLPHQDRAGPAAARLQIEGIRVCHQRRLRRLHVSVVRDNGGSSFQQSGRAAANRPRGTTSNTTDCCRPCTARLRAARGVLVPQPLHNVLAPEDRHRASAAAASYFHNVGGARHRRRSRRPPVYSGLPARYTPPTNNDSARDAAAPLVIVGGVAADCRHQRLCRHRAARNIQVPDTTPHHVPCHTHREVTRNAAAPLLHADGCIRHGYRARRPPVKSMTGGGDMAPAVATPVGRGAGRHLPLRAPPPCAAAAAAPAAQRAALQVSAGERLARVGCLGHLHAGGQQGPAGRRGRAGRRRPAVAIDAADTVGAAASGAVQGEAAPGCRHGAGGAGGAGGSRGSGGSGGSGGSRGSAAAASAGPAARTGKAAPPPPPAGGHPLAAGRRAVALHPPPLVQLIPIVVGKEAGALGRQQALVLDEVPIPQPYCPPRPVPRRHWPTWDDTVVAATATTATATVIAVVRRQRAIVSAAPTNDNRAIAAAAATPTLKIIPPAAAAAAAPAAVAAPTTTTSSTSTTITSAAAAVAAPSLPPSKGKGRPAGPQQPLTRTRGGGRGAPHTRTSPFRPPRRPATATAPRHRRACRHPPPRHWRRIPPPGTPRAARPPPQRQPQHPLPRSPPRTPFTSTRSRSSALRCALRAAGGEGGRVGGRRGGSTIPVVSPTMAAATEAAARAGVHEGADVEAATLGGPVGGVEDDGCIENNSTRAVHHSKRRKTRPTRCPSTLPPELEHINHTGTTLAQREPFETVQLVHPCAYDGNIRVVEAQCLPLGRGKGMRQLVPNSDIRYDTLEIIQHLSMPRQLLHKWAQRQVVTTR